MIDMDELVPIGFVAIEHLCESIDIKELMQKEQWIETFMKRIAWGIPVPRPYPRAKKQQQHFY
jgi:hypothetical protein